MFFDSVSVRPLSEFTSKVETTRQRGQFPGGGRGSQRHVLGERPSLGRLRRGRRPDDDQRQPDGASWLDAHRGVRLLAPDGEEEHHRPERRHSDPRVLRVELRLLRRSESGQPDAQRAGCRRWQHHLVRSPRRHRPRRHDRGQRGPERRGRRVHVRPAGNLRSARAARLHHIRGQHSRRQRRPDRDDRLLAGLGSRSGRGQRAGDRRSDVRPGRSRDRPQPDPGEPELSGQQHGLGQRRPLRGPLSACPAAEHGRR
jgi:hypothetical protein